MKRFSKSVAFLVVFISVMVAFCTVSFAEDFTNWTTKTNMLTAVCEFSTSNVGGKIYAFGGVSASKPGIATVQMYDPVSDTWTYKRDMPTARAASVSADVNGIIYVIGGSTIINNSGYAYATNEAYDPSTDSWTTKTKMPVAIHGASAVVVNGKIYVIGGATISNGAYYRSNKVYMYDPLTDSWTQKTNMPTARDLLSTVVVDGKIYAIGGHTDSSILSTVEMYNPETDTWVSKTSIKIPRFGLQSIEMDGIIYVLGGCTNSTFNAINSIEMYDIETNTWRTSGSLSYARGLLGASVIDKSVFIFGGLNTSSAYYNTTEQNIFKVTVLTLTATAANRQVTLNWNPVEGASGYNIYRSTTSGTGYTKIGSNTTSSAITYEDKPLTNGTTYYYVVTAIVNGVESGYSNEASATPMAPVVTGNFGILEITMVTGEIKEYDLTASEIQSFLTWYDVCSNGVDEAYYMMIKKNNIKPFLC